MAKRVLLVFFLLLSGLKPWQADAAADQHWSRTRPEINLRHIFFGMINGRGDPVGFHARPQGQDPHEARLVSLVSRPDRQGVYSARVEIFDTREGRWKEKFSTFFPDTMSRDEVTAAILHAYHHRWTGNRQPWSGPSGHGFAIQGYLNHRGNINTAFPLYQGGKP